MPRHPPCALTHLTTTRCSHPLCNTQHTTTPQPPHRHHKPHHPHGRQAGCVRPARPGMATKNTPSQVSPQDPTVCQARLHHTGRSCPNQQRYVFHPATPTTSHPTMTNCLIRCGISERRPSPPSQPRPKPEPTLGSGTINSVGSLERR